MKFFRCIKDFILSYYYPKGQYFLISFPKTGRTWLIHIIHQMKDLSRNDFKTKDNFIYSDHDNSEIIIENGTRNNPLDIFNFSSRYKYRRSKVIFLVRDPRDVIVSHFHQVTKRSKNPFLFSSITDFVRDDIIGFKRIIHYYNLWFNNKDIPENFLLIKYEKLLNNGLFELEKIKIFLELDISINDIEKIYNASTANNMRVKEIDNKFKDYNDFGKERNYLKVRNAKIGGYVNELSNEDILFCNKEMLKLNPYFEYKI